MPVFNTRQNNQYIGVLETVSTQVQIRLSGYGILQTIKHTKTLRGKVWEKIFTSHFKLKFTYTHTHTQLLNKMLLFSLLLLFFWGGGDRARTIREKSSMLPIWPVSIYDLFLETITNKKLQTQLATLVPGQMPLHKSATPRTFPRISVIPCVCSPSLFS